MNFLDEIANLGVRDVFTIYKDINQAKIDRDFSDSQNTINELNASATLLRLQNEARQTEAFNSGQFNPNAASDMKKYLGYGLLAAAALAAGYLLVKK
ncbi:MAG: hypothetical protein V4605_08850 [Pseudomonadota bacterium]